MSLDKLVDSTQLDSNLTSVANAIRAKGGTSSQLAFPSGFVSAINNIPTGEPTVEVAANDVNFRDYDGKILYSYSATDFSNLSALPPNPSHQGLIAQGWNWTLQDAQAFLSSTNDVLDIGQNYITSDGKTRLYVTIDDDFLRSFRIAIFAIGTVVVDWGDNSATETVTGTSLTSVKITGDHTYPSLGSYVITLSTDGELSIGGASGNIFRTPSDLQSSSSNSTVANCSTLKKVEIGQNVTRIGSYGFNYCIGLKTISIPKTVTAIRTYAFRYCYSLQSVVIPHGITTIEQSAFDEDQCMTSVCAPNTITSLGNNAFDTCKSLRFASSIISNITVIKSSALYNWYSLTKVIINSDVITIEANAFGNCYSVRELHFQPSTPPTVSASSAFYNIPTYCKIYVPRGKLTDYQNATNYPSSSTYTYLEE